MHQHFRPCLLLRRATSLLGSFCLSGARNSSFAGTSPPTSQPSTTAASTPARLSFPRLTPRLTIHRLFRLFQPFAIKHQQNNFIFASSGHQHPIYRIVFTRTLNLFASAALVSADRIPNIPSGIPSIFKPRSNIDFKSDYRDIPRHLTTLILAASTHIPILTHSRIDTPSERPTTNAHALYLPHPELSLRLPDMTRPLSLTSH